jgi:hypothetical protein
MSVIMKIMRISGLQPIPVNGMMIPPKSIIDVAVSTSHPRTGPTTAPSTVAPSTGPTAAPTTVNVSV